MALESWDQQPESASYVDGGLRREGQYKTEGIYNHIANGAVILSNRTIRVTTHNVVYQSGKGHTAPKSQ